MSKVTLKKRAKKNVQTSRTHRSDDHRDWRTEDQAPTADMTPHQGEGGSTIGGGSSSVTGSGATNLSNIAKNRFKQNESFISASYPSTAEYIKTRGTFDPRMEKGKRIETGTITVGKGVEKYGDPGFAKAMYQKGTTVSSGTWTKKGKWKLDEGKNAKVYKGVKGKKGSYDLEELRAV